MYQLILNRRHNSLWLVRCVPDKRFKRSYFYSELANCSRKNQVPKTEIWRQAEMLSIIGSLCMCLCIYLGCYGLCLSKITSPNLSRNSISSRRPRSCCIINGNPGRHDTDEAFSFFIQPHKDTSTDEPVLPLKESPLPSWSWVLRGFFSTTVEELSHCNILKLSTQHNGARWLLWLCCVKDLWRLLVNCCQPGMQHLGSW